MVQDLDRKWNYLQYCKPPTRVLFQWWSFHFHVTAHEIFILLQLEKQRAAGSLGGLKRHFTLQLDAFARCTASYFHSPGRRADRQVTPAAPYHRWPHTQFPHISTTSHSSPKVEKPLSRSPPGVHPQRTAQINAEPLCAGPHVNEAQFIGYAQRKGGNRCGSWRLDSCRGPVSARRSAPDMDSAPLGNATADYLAYTSQRQEIIQKKNTTGQQTADRRYCQDDQSLCCTVAAEPSDKSCVQIAGESGSNQILSKLWFLGPDMFTLFSKCPCWIWLCSDWATFLKPSDSLSSQWRVMGDIIFFKYCSNNNLLCIFLLFLCYLFVRIINTVISILYIRKLFGLQFSIIKKFKIRRQRYFSQLRI